MGVGPKTCHLLAVAITISASSQSCTKVQYKSDRKCLPCQDICHDKRSIGYNQCLDFCTEKKAVNEKCSKGYYYDDNQARCDNCNSICDKHESMGTSGDCKKHCPREFEKFLKSTTDCLEGSYYDANDGKCADCKTLCENSGPLIITDSCKNYCQKESRSIKKQTSTSDTGLNKFMKIIGSSIGVGLIMTTILCVICVKYLNRRRLTSSNTPSRDEEDEVSPTATYVPITDPIHDQCTDDGYISLESSAGTMTCIVREEEEKFPLAFPELPSSARPISDIF